MTKKQFEEIIDQLETQNELLQIMVAKLEQLKNNNFFENE